MSGMAASSLQIPLPPHNDRAAVEIEDVQVGGVLWIRRQKFISSRYSNLQLDPNSYNHPAIVIKVKKLDGKEPLVTIAPVSMKQACSSWCKIVIN